MRRDDGRMLNGLGGSVGGRRLVLLSGLLAACFLMLASSASALMLGLHWQKYDTGDLEIVKRSGASVYHVPLDYSGTSGGNWGSYDSLVEAAWKRGVTIVPGLIRSGPSGNRFLLQSDPGWVSWGAWAREAVERYGVNGSFWNGKSNPTPITAWEVWNEPNLVENNPKIERPECQLLGQAYYEKIAEPTCVQPQNYGKFLRYTAEKLQAGSFTKTAHGTEVLFGGLALQAGDDYNSFLTKAFSISGVSGSFTGLSIHPYSFDTGLSGMADQIAGARYRLNALGAGGKSLWITEVGWPVSGTEGFPANRKPVTEAQQAEFLTQGFNWIKANAAGMNIQLATWYNIRDFNTGAHWDGSCGLLRQDGSHRPAWNAFQEETGASAPAVIGQVTTDGRFFAKQGSLGAEWTQESEGIKAIAVASDPTNDPFIGEVSTSGDLYVKQGLGSEWVHESEGIKAIALASDGLNGLFIGELSTSGDFYVKQGLGGEWVLEGSGIKEIAMASDPVHGPLIGELGTDGRFFAKQGVGGEWVLEGSGIQQIALATDSVHGPLIGELGTDSRFFAKQGGLEAGWVQESVGIQQIALAIDRVHGPLIAELSTSGTYYAKQGGLEAGWVQESVGIKSIAVSSDPTNGALIGELTPDNRLFVKEGGLEAGWVEESPAAQSFALAG